MSKKAVNQQIAIKPEHENVNKADNTTQKWHTKVQGNKEREKERKGYTRKKEREKALTTRAVNLVLKKPKFCLLLNLQELNKNLTLQTGSCGCHAP